jgi:hypothetical protein
MVWVRLAQPAQQAILKLHECCKKTITSSGDIRGDFAIYLQEPGFIKALPCRWRLGRLAVSVF